MISLIQRKNKMNKKAGIGLIIFFSVLIIVLIIGFAAAIILSIIDYVSDEVTPIMEDLGVIEGTSTNMSEYAGWGFGTLDTVVQSLPWVVALGYVMVLVFTLVFIFIIGYNPHPAFIGFYIALMLLLILGCIMMSNIYQDLYEGTDEIAIRLHDQTILSFLILHSPFVMAMIGIIGGILMFARQSSSEGGGVGGFGV